MRKLLFLLILIRFIPAAAQPCTSEFLGTKTLYTFNEQHYTPVPFGYQPVFINYVGRHGARHLTKDIKNEFVYQLLAKADSANALSADGKVLWKMVKALQQVEQGNTKSISEEGKNELKGIGERMNAASGEIFNHQPKLNVAITKEIRTKQSADAFLSGLTATWKTQPAINEYNDDTDLRFYDAAPAYRAFKTSDVVINKLDQLKKNRNISAYNNEIVLKFFTTAFVNKLDEDQKDKFVSDLFGYAAIVYSLRAEITQAGYQFADLDIASVFTCEQLKALGEISSADEDLKKGPGIDVNGIQVRVAVPLLVNFIKTSDEFISTGNYNAQLRFAHAETIAPFAALLGISVADKVAKDPGTIKKLWQASVVIPLSANIQWVFCRKQHDDQYLVKVMLNEKEEDITGLKPVYGHYYNWRDLRLFYLARLKKLNVSLNDDMAAYLANLK